MAENEKTPGTSPVSDQRPVPRGVIPRGVQTWLMLGLAGAMLLIILIAGHPATPPRTATSAAPAVGPSPDRVRDYQDRLRALEAQAQQEAQAPSPSATPGPPREEHAPAEDPLAAERKRREFDSRFSSTIAFSRGMGSQTQSGGTPATPSTAAAGRSGSPTPSIDEIADAVVRATGRANPAQTTTTVHRPNEPQRTPGAESLSDARSERRSSQTRGEKNVPAGRLYRVLEGTLIETALINRLSGDLPSQVECHVITDVYSSHGHRRLIPVGAKILGESKPIQALGETRLAVAFHRVELPDSDTTYDLDQYPGLNQIGDTGLRDRVNQHYWSIFGASAAVGLVSGFAQFIGASRTGASGNSTVVVSGGAVETTAQATMQVMNRFTNRLPTVTIDEGHRVQIYLTSDLELPEYEPWQGARAF